MRAVLTYHSIDDSGSPVSVAPHVFESHLRWFSSGEITVVPVGELAHHRSGPPAVAITFDDALESAAQYALPQLTALGLPVTVFVTSQHVGRDNRWGGVATRGIPVLPVMSWRALGEWAGRGVAIGAHTRTHPSLPKCPTNQQLEEIAGCREDIARELGIVPEGFAYPYGDSNEAVRTLAAQHYEWSVGTVLRPLGAQDRMHDLPRLDAWYFRDPRRLHAWGSAALTHWLTFRRIGRLVRAAVA